jgi:phenylacetyl-CoA:acceptor oxidoreductase 26-kDa subunit
LGAARGIPAWRQAGFVDFIFVTGLAEGTGLFLVLGSKSAAPAALALGTFLLREIAWLAYLRGLNQKHAPALSLAVLSTS